MYFVLDDFSSCNLSSMVELSRTAYQEPVLPIPPKRSIAIENKKIVLIGEVVNGGPLPNPPQHTPVYSFDPNNKYRGDLASLETLPTYIKGWLMYLIVVISDFVVRQDNFN